MEDVSSRAAKFASIHFLQLWYNMAALGGFEPEKSREESDNGREWQPTFAEATAAIYRRRKESERSTSLQEPCVAGNVPRSLRGVTTFSDILANC